MKDSIAHDHFTYEYEKETGNPVEGASYSSGQIEKVLNKKKLEVLLRESGENYRKMVNLSPDAIIIFVNGIIVLANEQMTKYIDNPIGERLEKCMIPDHVRIMKKRVGQILKNKVSNTFFDYKFLLKDGSIVDVEVSSSYFSYKGKPAILSSIRDISDRKKELNSAAIFQMQLLQKPFPVTGKVEMETLYVPAKTVSGDFYFIHKVDENLVIGILGDVSGKGISAALSISAFNVLFHEAVLISHDPSEIVNNLNKKIVNYLGERYIAACCFCLDFQKNEAKVVGAGINQFIFQNDLCNKIIVRGPFLGMFENGVFDEQIINFRQGDIFFFFTDGLDFIFFDNKIVENKIRTNTIKEIRDYLNDTLSDMLTDIGGIKDDCTMLMLEIK